MAGMWLYISDDGTHLINLSNVDGIVLDTTITDDEPFIKIYKIDPSSGRQVPLFFEIYDSEEEAKRVFQNIIGKI